MRRNQYKVRCNGRKCPNRTREGTQIGQQASEPYARGYADRVARFGCRMHDGTLQVATSVGAVITHQRTGWLPSTEE